jgi:mannobiose 2-epimerase
MMVATTSEQPALLLPFKTEVEEELHDILSWWMHHMPDQQYDGFHASIDNDNIIDTAAPKGVVLNSRILWTFSAAYHFSKRQEYLQVATRACDYIFQRFVDKQHGGVYWSVDLHGRMYDGRKQVYGQAFCIYGMVEYYKACNDDRALQLAKDIYHCIEKYSLDPQNGGYIEAFTREWNAIDDLRLSEKDDNEKKSMNTHLHLIEAYASLYTIWPDRALRERIADLLNIFDRYIINKDTNHLNLFMDENWRVRSTLVSFGHDIEAAWLLLECAGISGYKLYIEHYKELSLKLASAAVEGLDEDGGLWYEYDPVHDHWIREKHSWPQAEAMVGFFSAWQLSSNEEYFRFATGAWEFIKRQLKDTTHGEWFWGIANDGKQMAKEKAGFWKCPYHGARACIEISRRVTTLL